MFIYVGLVPDRRFQQIFTIVGMIVSLLLNSTPDVVVQGI